MKRIVRISLIGAAALTLVFVIGIGALLVTVNPNDFKPEIEAAARKATGKELSLAGDLALSFFPGLSLKAGPAEFKDDPAFGSEPFARLESLTVSVELLPLFSRRAEIKAIAVSGLRLKLTVNESGRANWTPPAQSSSGETPSAKPAAGAAPSLVLASIALDSLTITDALLVYTDMRSKSETQFGLANFELHNLRTGQKTALALEASYTGPMARPILLSLAGDFTLPPSMADGIPCNAKGKLDDTELSFSGAFALPETAEGQLYSLKGALDAGTVNIDTYAAAPGKPKAAKPDGGNGATARKADPDADASLRDLLRILFLDLQVTLKSLTVAKIPVSDIKATIKADEGLLVAKPVTMAVAEAPVSVEASLDARENAIRGRVTGDWKSARLGSLFAAATGKTPLTGTLDAAWSLNATGTSWPEAARTLEGTVHANLAEGTVRAFTLIPSGVPGLPAKTLDLANLTASGTWTIAKGIANNNDLAVRATGLAAAGSGRVNIPALTCDYAVSVELPTIPELPNLTVLPVRISGPLASPAYRIDQPALLRDTAKSILDPTTKAGGELQKAGERLGRFLRQ